MKKAKRLVVFINDKKLFAVNPVVNLVSGDDDLGAILPVAMDAHGAEYRGGREDCQRKWGRRKQKTVRVFWWFFGVSLQFGSNLFYPKFLKTDRKLRYARQNRN